MTQIAPDSSLGSMANGEAPVLETVLAMNLDSLERSALDPKTYFLVRLGALVAMDAGPVSYAMTLAAATDAGLGLEDMQGVLIAVAPVVGTARVTAAAGNILRAALGAEALAEATASLPEQRS
ncbi:MAG: carboxymuconolactone decarboxylase family protein [Catenulispora sp.]